MHQVSLNNTSKSKNSKGRASHRMAGLFLFVSVITVTNVQAETQKNQVDLGKIQQQVFPHQKDPEIVALYNQVFGEDELSRKVTSANQLELPANPINVVIPKKKGLSTAIKLQYLIDDLNKADDLIPIRKRKRTLSLNTKEKAPRPKKSIAQKDPEIVALYEQIFGKVDSSKTKNKGISKKQTIKPDKRISLKKRVKINKAVISQVKNKPLTKRKNKKVLNKQPPISENKLQYLIDDLTQTDTTTNKLTEKKDVARSRIKTTSSPAVSVNNTLKSNQLHTTGTLIKDVIGSNDVRTSTEKKLQGLINKLKDDSSVKDKISEKVIPSAAQNVDLDALYTKAFGKKKSRVKETIPTSNNAPNLEALFAKAFGKKSAAAPSQVSVDLRINNTMKLGDITLFSTAGAIDKVSVKELLEHLKDILKDHIYKRIFQSLSKFEKVSIAKLAELDLKAEYNSVNLSLDMQINPELRKPRVLSLRSKRSASVREENKIKADDISGFLNMYSTLGLNKENSNADVKMKFEGSLGVKDVVFETSVDIKKSEQFLGRTSLTYDKPDKLQRTILGDISTGNRNFQENLELTGLRVSKEFFMKPEFQIRPRANQSFILRTKSEVEVFINDQLRKRYYLNEGVYSLEDIGLYEGVNNIRVRITDEFGKVIEKTSKQYYDSHLLSPGLSLFSLSVGYLSNKQAVANTALKNTPIFSGYYQKGITKNLTLNIDSQISSDRYLLGAEAITSFPFGSLKNSIAFSRSSAKGSGFATRFELKPNIQRQLINLDTLREDMLSLDTSVGRFLNSWTVLGEFRSQDFSMINQNDSITINNAIKTLKTSLQTRFNFDLSENWRANINIGVRDYYDFDYQKTASISATRRFYNGLQLSLGANYDSHDDFSIRLELSIPLSREKGKRRKSLSLLADSKDQTYRSKVTVNPLGLVGKNSLAGSLETSSVEGKKQQALKMNYRGSNFETNLNIRGTEQLNIGFNSSLACVGKRCGLSYPINDSFALVTGPSNQQAPIALSNGQRKFTYNTENDDGLPDNYTAVIRKAGSNAIVPLESYSFQNINVDESTLPNGYDTEKTEFEVFPKYHQGFLIKAGGEPSTTLSGVLLGQDQKPLGFKGGQWVSLEDKGKTIAFFSNKVGRFRIYSIPAGKYSLELFDYLDMKPITINVPDLKGKVHKLGTLIIR